MAKIIHIVPVECHFDKNGNSLPKSIKKCVKVDDFKNFDRTYDGEGKRIFERRG